MNNFVLFFLALSLIDAAILPNATDHASQLNPSLKASAPKLSGSLFSDLHVFKFRQTGSKYTYLGFENPNANPITRRQSKGVDAELTKSLIEARLGTSAYGIPHFPPGFINLRNAGKCPHRGHLLARELGGSGTHVENIVTLTEQVNINVMRPYENEVANLWNSGNISEKCLVRYKVRARYESKSQRLHPRSITIDARVYNPFDDTERLLFNVEIENELGRSRPTPQRGHLGIVICTPTPEPNQFVTVNLFPPRNPSASGVHLPS